MKQNNKMTSRNLNQYQSPTTIYQRTPQLTPDTHYPSFASSQQIPINFENDLHFGSPYFGHPQTNFHRESINPERITNGNFQSFNGTSHGYKNSTRQSDLEMSDARSNQDFKPIPNKYGLEVKRIGKTPRNSHSEYDNSNSLHKKISLTPINKVEKSPINAQLTEITRTLTPIKVIPFGQDNMPKLNKLPSIQNGYVVVQHPVNILKQPEQGELLTTQLTSGLAMVKRNSGESLQNQHSPLLPIKTNNFEFISTQQTSLTPLKKKSVDLLTVESIVNEINQKSKEVVHLELEGVGSYEGTLKHNSMHGYGKLYDTQKRIVYEGEFVMNQFEGIGIQYNYPELINHKGQTLQARIGLPEHWSKFEGLFHNSKKTGISSLYFADGGNFVGTFEDDEVNGFGTYNSKTGECFKGRWKNNVLIDFGN